MSAKPEHKATVDKGLKMKIKRKSTGSKAELKHEIVASASKDKDTTVDDNHQAVNGHVMSEDTEAKTLLLSSPKSHGKMSKSGKQKSKKGRKSRGGGGADRQQPDTDSSRVSSMLNKGRVMVTLNRLDTSEMKSPPKTPPSADQDPGLRRCERSLAVPQTLKFSCPQDDQWSTDGAALPANKNEVGVATEPECLGPCEPGTNVTLEGIVWTETDHGMLVVNVTWRGKTYIGTLLDAGQDEWAPPSFGAEAEARATKGRRRPRGAAAGAEAVVLSGARRLRNRKIFAPSSPARAEETLLGKRKGQQTAQNPPKEEGTPAKRARSCDGDSSQNLAGPVTEVKASPMSLIECPEDSCQKKYQHANGLRYHQAHAHPHSLHTLENSQIYGPKDSVSEDRPTSTSGSAQRKWRRPSPILQQKTVGQSQDRSGKPAVKTTTTSSVDRDNKHGVTMPSAQTNERSIPDTPTDQHTAVAAVVIKEERRSSSGSNNPSVSQTPVVHSKGQSLHSKPTPISTSQHASPASQHASISANAATNQISVSKHVTNTMSTQPLQSSVSSQPAFKGPVLPPVTDKLTVPLSATPVSSFTPVLPKDSSTSTHLSSVMKSQKKDRPQILNVPSSTNMLLVSKDSTEGKMTEKPSSTSVQLSSPLGYPFHSTMDRKEAARFGGPAVFHSSAESPGRGLDLSLKSPKVLGNHANSSTSVQPTELGPPHLEPMVYRAVDTPVADNTKDWPKPAAAASKAGDSLPSLAIKSENVLQTPSHSPRVSSPLQSSTSQAKDAAFHTNLAARNTHLLVPKLPQRTAATCDLVKKTSSSDNEHKRLSSPSETKPLLKSLVNHETTPKRSVSPGQQPADLSKMKGHGHMEPRNHAAMNLRPECNDMRSRQLNNADARLAERQQNNADARLAERQYHLQKYVHFQQQKMLEQQQQQLQQQQQQHKHASPLASPQMEQWLHEGHSRAHEAAKLAAHLQNGGSMLQGSSELQRLLIHDERMSLSPPVSRGLTTPPGMSSASIPMSVAMSRGLTTPPGMSSASIPMSVAMSPVSTVWHHPHHPSIMSKVPHLARGQLLQNGAVYSGNPVHGNAMAVAAAGGRYMSPTEPPRYPGTGSPQLHGVPISRPL